MGLELLLSQLSAILLGSLNLPSLFFKVAALLLLLFSALLYFRTTAKAAGVIFTGALTLLLLLFGSGKSGLTEQNELSEIIGTVSEFRQKAVTDPSGFTAYKAVLVVEKDNLKTRGSFTSDKPLEIKEGNLVLLEGYFKPVLEKNYFYSEDFTHTGTIHRFEILDAAEKTGTVTEYFDTYFSNSPYSALYSGYLLGRRGSISDETMSQFRENGLLHILAISGSHIVIIASFIFLVLKLLFIPPKIKWLLLSLVLSGYLVLLGFQPAPLRAIAFTLLLTSAILLERKISLLNILYLSSAVVLIISPEMIYSLGFQLSFLATFGILFMLPLVENLTARFFSSGENRNLPARLMRYLANSLLIGFSAQLFVIPLLLLYFGSCNLFSVLLTIPATLCFVVMLYSLLLGAALFLIIKPAGLFLLDIADISNSVMLRMLNYTKNIKIFELQLKMTPFTAVLIYLLMLAALYLLLNQLSKHSLKVKIFAKSGGFE